MRSVIPWGRLRDLLDLLEVVVHALQRLSRCQRCRRSSKYEILPLDVTVVHCTMVLIIITVFVVFFPIQFRQDFSADWLCGLKGLLADETHVS